jgi:phosphatidylserine/phosphatidylglycerophosphate/cardiolipin synthase-like enzyme
VARLAATRAGNVVTPLIDGHSTFDAMAAAIRSATGPEHFVYLAAWWLNLDTPMTANGVTLRRLLEEPERKKVEVRALVWDSLLPAYDLKRPVYRLLPGFKNTSEVAWINTLECGAAILDNRTLRAGAHHQKLVVVGGADGLVGFCGGLDISLDRIEQTSQPKGSPMHDVHCRIMGPAAFDLLRTFLERWGDHPSSLLLDRRKIRDRTRNPTNESIAPRLLGWSHPVPSAIGPHTVQIGRTYPNGKRHSGIGRDGYTFAPDGEQTAWHLIRQTIREAERYLYIEDQYLVSEEASREVMGVLPRVEHVTILVTHDEISDLPQVAFRRYRFLEPLRRAGGKKLRAFHLTDPADKTTFKSVPHCYVHSKVVIADDRVAIIGSANWNRRGFTHDSEIVARISDRDGRFARELRIALWSEHLAVPQEQVADPIAAAALWMTPGPGSRVAPYDERPRVSIPYEGEPDGTWNTLWDPDGS